MTTVLISGLGLIGGSLARVMKNGTEAPTIIGADPNDDTSQFLLDQRVIDQRLPFEQAAPLADIIILAGPVAVIIKQLHVLTTLSLKPDVLVTDAGSTKQQILAAAQPLKAQQITFMGGHPMAGSHQSGGRASRSNLFDGATYFLVDGWQTAQQTAQFQHLLSDADLKWVNLTARDHDALVSEISHVPHVLAANLVNTADAQLQHDPVGLSAAAGGFKSTTRIAGADPTVWTNIMLSNADAITSQLTSYMVALDEIKQAIEHQDTDAIYDFFAHAQAIRQQLDSGGNAK